MIRTGLFSGLLGSRFLGRVSRTAICAATLTLLPAAASAFCGFFVSGADTKLYNNASQVVLMRKGNHTVMTMSNNYKGPPEHIVVGADSVVSRG